MKQVIYTQPVEPEVHHVEPELDWVDLDDPEDHPADAEEDEEEEPEPHHEEHLGVEISIVLGMVYKRHHGKFV